MKSEVMYRITMSGMTPEKKKQVKSEVMYRITMSGMTPEKKKQVKSEVVYRITVSGMAPEKKKQAKSEVMSRMRKTHKIAYRTVDMLTNACFFHTLRKNENVSVKALNRYR